MITATQMDLPAMEIPEQPRTLRFNFAGIRYQVVPALRDWRAPLDDHLLCLSCDDYLDVIAPNLLHSVPLAMCSCSSSFLEPVDESDRGLLELQYPTSEQDAKHAERFRSQLRRLGAPGSLEGEAK
jgi:hypothetical protein